ILETSELGDLAAISKILKDCDALGIHVALDDFGTGYSSLTYLKGLPARQLKIDRSFVRDILTDPDDLSIVDGLVGLANAFGLDLVAEGVESVKHGKVLLDLGCTCAQGYVIARPMPAVQVADWLVSWKAPREWLHHGRNISSVSVH
ncbi:MAG: EAL domain-containing protein, partial [Oceanobacter sp.]